MYHQAQTQVHVQVQMQHRLAQWTWSGTCGDVSVFVKTLCKGDNRGHSASRPVQIYCYSVRVSRWGCFYVCWYAIVPGSETLSWAEKTPGLIVPSNTAAISVCFPPDSFVCHSDCNRSCPPYLPVKAPSQTIAAKHLFPAIQSLWMIRLLLFHQHGFSVVCRQFEVSFCCVWVQCKFTENWWWKQERYLYEEFLNMTADDFIWLNLYSQVSTDN